MADCKRAYVRATRTAVRRLFVSSQLSELAAKSNLKFEGLTWEEDPQGHEATTAG